MIVHPQFDPVMFQLGFLKVHWYGVMYLLGFTMAWGLAVYRVKRGDIDWSVEQISDFVFYSALGVIIGGRLGYMLFYDLSNWFNDPIRIIRFWNGGISGMSFHGGLLGVITAVWFYACRHHKSFWSAIDFAAPLVPLGLAAGRLGNFINSELWGRVTDMPWGMIFPNVDSNPRHPSQLYEFMSEGLILFFVMWFFVAKPRPRMAASGVFLIGYGCARFFVEFFREPDPQLGYMLFNYFTMGQILSFPMIVIGVCLLKFAYKRQRLMMFDGVS